MPRFILTRHGQTDFNAQQKYQGNMDIPLNAQGEAQARFLTPRLASIKLDAVYSSDLQRAVKTAEIALENHPSGLQPRQLELLREINGGAFEGLGWAEFSARYPEESLLWREDRTHVRPPGGGENLLDAAERLDQALKQILAEVPDPDATILLVLHGGIISLLLCKVMGMELERLWQWRIDNCSITILDLYEKGGILSLFNDIAHIKAS
jgi:broad specificity phosphatase PhoE